MVVSLNSRLESYKEEEGKYLVPSRTAPPRAWMGEGGGFRVWGLGFRAGMGG